MNDPSDGGQQQIARVGDVVAGKFVVERVLGEGGMGVVVAARHMQLDEQVALKFLRPGMMNPEMMARFAQEARAAVKLKSEHVARVLDVGMREDGVPFIVMEYLQGRDLSALIRAGGPLAPEMVADLIIQACEGLAEAHARGIVHRDIKPENLFLAEHAEGWQSVKILDFGISKAGLTGSGVIKADSNIKTRNLLGSPCYMSPEQLRSTQSVDRRTDLWSLGVVMFELLTGTSAYSPEGTLSEVIVTILEQPPPRVSAFRPDIPPALDWIVDRCLQRDLNQRFQNAAELAIALLPLAPKGARTKVQRAIAVTRAAGLAGNSLALLDSVAPPPKSAEATGPFSASPLSASSPGPPSFTPGQGISTGPNHGVSSLADTSPFGAPAHPPVAVTSGSSGARQTGRAVTIASAGIAALLCAGVFAWIARRGPSPAEKGHADLPTTSSSAGGVAAGVVAPSAPTAPPAVTLPSVPAEGGSGEMPAPSAQAADANATQAPAAPSKKRPAAAPPVSHPDAGPSAPAEKDLDIRRQR